MIFFALVKPDGFISQIVSYSVDNPYEENQSYNGYIAHEIPYEEVMKKPHIIMADWYWMNGWHERPPQPSIAYRWNNEKKEWELDTEAALQSARDKRNVLLAQSDWTQLPDSPFTEEQRNMWRDYRAALRNMTDQDFLDNNFPSPPLF